MLSQGHRIPNSRSTSPSSGAANETGCFIVAITAAGVEMPASTACGIARPSPVAVDPRRSRRRSAFRTSPCGRPVLRPSLDATASSAERFSLDGTPNRKSSSSRSSLSFTTASAPCRARADRGAGSVGPAAPPARRSNRCTTGNGTPLSAGIGCRKGRRASIGIFSCHAPSMRRAGAVGMNRIVGGGPGAGVTCGNRG